MLGNAKEARQEFAQLSPAARLLPECLGVEWQLLAEEKHWEEAAAVADAHVKAAPDQPEAWIHRSFALHELRRTQTARDRLLPAAKLFPRETTIPYNLACYECQLGDLPAAREWLRRALQRDPAARRERLAMALQDPDLQPLVAEIQRGDFDA